jgi:predicted phosphoribosyltransferase
MFRDRQDAGQQLADRLKGRPLRRPVVLGIPRGGVVLGAVLAGHLGADLDVVLARKLRAPRQHELALGAISESGEVYLTQLGEEWSGALVEYLAEERQRQAAEIARRARLFRAVRSAVPLAGRSVIVTDDGIATGSTMMAALKVARAQQPLELIVAVPVASPDRLEEVAHCCEETVCLLCPDDFQAIGQFYEDFTQVEDDEVVALLRTFAGKAPPGEPEPHPRGRDYRPSGR